MKHILLALPLLATPAMSAEVELWRLDCGEIQVNFLNAFSDTMAYTGQAKTLTDSCYLIRHDDEYLMWDTGLPTAMLGAPVSETEAMSPTLAKDLPSQLAEIGVSPDQIGKVGISHYHFDHTGQAASFPAAMLYIGAADWSLFSADPLPPFLDPSHLQPWLDGGEVVAVPGDLDIFGDGTVTMLRMPGHTPGETALLVNLAETGPVLLSGDVVHFAEQLPIDGVPAFNWDRAETLASLDRITALADNLGAVLVIQHDATHIGKLPAFPASAK